ncbi:MAG: putative 2OG-Fe(II) oxygenase, partial [Hyphococcus sp.]
RAQVYGQTGDHETEYAILREAARLSGDPPLAYAACNAALSASAYDEAEAFARSAVAALPNDESALSAYCRALLAVGKARESAAVSEALRQRQPLNQLFIALQATAWRMLGDERYHALYDYDAFVFTSPLDTPKGWSSLDAYLADLVEALDEAHKYKTHPFNQSVRHGSQISSINGSENPAMRAYGEAASGPIQRFINSLSEGDDPLRSRNIGGFRLYSTWSISLPPNGFHVNHVHPEGWLSSACHLRTAQPDPGNDKAGYLKFGEPGINTSPALAPEHFVAPEPGVLAVFPSYMWHGTVGFSTGRPRLTIAVDIVPAETAQRE